MGDVQRNPEDSLALITAIVDHDDEAYAALVAGFPAHPRPDLCNMVLVMGSLLGVNDRLNGSGILREIDAGGALGEGGMSPSGWSILNYLDWDGRVIGKVHCHASYGGPTFRDITVEFSKVGPDWRPVTDEIMSWY